jgi:hypothetical protein
MRPISGFKLKKDFGLCAKITDSCQILWLQEYCQSNIIALFENMTPETIKSKITAIAAMRSSLVRLSQQPNLGNLSIDVAQTLEEIDDLLLEFKKTFPDCSIGF